MPRTSLAARTMTRVLGAPGASLAPVEDIRRLVNAGRRHPGAGHQGSDRHQGRASDDLHRPAVALPRVHAARRQAIGVSARIEDEAERTRLKVLLGQLADAAPPKAATSSAPPRRVPARRTCARTCATSPSSGSTCARERGAARAGSVVHEDLPLSLRVLRDELARGVSRVLVDSARELAAHASNSPRPSCPSAASVIELYGGPRPIFDLNGIEEEIAQGARSQGAAEVRRPPGHRPDRSR